MNIKKGDNVIVISGKDKGKQGKVVRVFPARDSIGGKIIVENINLKKKHQKPKSAGKKGETISVSRPVFLSTVKLICKNCGKPTRTGSKIMNDPSATRAGKKVRICKKCGLEA